MYKIFFKISLFIFLAGALPLIAHAMGHVSDTISSSWPSINANHTIIFESSHPIPPGGKIVIRPASGQFAVLNDFDYTDIDLATSSTRDGAYTERALAAAPTASEDGVSMTASSTLDNITIALNTTYGIDEGDYVRIKLGTNAVYGENGNRQIYNAIATGTYRLDLESFTGADEFLDRGNTMLVMIEPVTMTASQPKIRSNGRPTGVLAYGTVQTLMSLNTNYIASCRFSTTSNTLYENMTATFSYTGAFLHSIMLFGLENGVTYSYYVRCQDEYLVNDLTDYLITFEVSLQPGEEGEETGTPGPGSGGSGGGGGGGFGRERGRGRGNLLPYPPLPDLPGVALSGWAYPLSELVVLRDGQEEGAISVNSKAEFGAFLPELPQGVYTFGLWATDTDGRRSITYSTTFWIDDGTQTVVNDIVLPPTISLSEGSLLTGGTVSVSGQSAPGSTVEIWLYPKQSGEPKADAVVKKTAVADSNGRWSSSVNANELKKGIYYVKAKTTLLVGLYSNFGQILELSVDTEPVVGECAGADLNGDGRVNITDFSILLYWWGTDNACADQNHDGIVNLTDFSIMMFYWTG